MKLSNKLNAVIAPLALVFTAAAVTPAFAHHETAVQNNFSCKRDDLAAWKLKSPIQKITLQTQLAKMLLPTRVSVANPSKKSGGSGVVIDKDQKLIITNNHVVEGAKEILISTYDEKGHHIPGGVYEASLVGTDPEADIAVLKLTDKDAPAIPCAPLGDSSKVEVLQNVIAIGDPFGLTSTVSMGVVSAIVRRSFDRDVSPVQDFIQVDAAVNPGNSGGPLFNMDGEVIGINTMIYSKVGEFNGNAFAVESNMARNIASRFINGEKVSHGLLGVAIRDVSKEDAKKLGMKEPHGVAILGGKDPRSGQDISAVAPGGPADKAGIKDGDIIINFGGHDIKDSEALRSIVSKSPANLKTDITVLRNGEKVKLEVTLGEMKPSQNQESRRGAPPQDQEPEGMPPFGQGPQGQMPGQGNGGNNFYFAPGSNPQFFMAPGAAPQGLQQAPRGGQQLPPGFFGQPDGPGEGAPELPPGPYGDLPQGQPQLPPGSPFPEEPQQAPAPQQKAPRQPPAWALPQP